jgi:vacuolar protein sorting-associated protein 13A/C
MYLSALQSFSQSAFASDEPVEVVVEESESPEESESGSDAAAISNKAITEASSGDNTG